MRITFSRGLRAVGAYFGSLVHPSARHDVIGAARQQSFIAAHLLAGLLALLVLPVYLSVTGTPTLLDIAAFLWFLTPIGIAVFLSRTGNLAKRLATHEQWPEAQLMGATHILIHQHDERDAREYVEADLAEALKPAMNGPFFDAELTEAAEAGGVRLVWAA